MFEVFEKSCDIVASNSENSNYPNTFTPKIVNLIEHEFSDNVDISEDSQVPFQEFSELSEELYSIFSPLRTWTSLSSFVSLFESLDKTCIVDDSEDLMASIYVPKNDEVTLDPDLNPESHSPKNLEPNLDLCTANLAHLFQKHQVQQFHIFL